MSEVLRYLRSLREDVLLSPKSVWRDACIHIIDLVEEYVEEKLEEESI